MYYRADNTQYFPDSDEKRSIKEYIAAQELASLYGAALKTLPLYRYSPGATTLSQASIRPSLSVASSHEEPPMRVDLRPLSPYGSVTVTESEDE